MTAAGWWWTAAALLPLVAWLWLALLRGGFWRADQRLPKSTPVLQDWPAVVAVVPARDEAACIGPTLRALLTQDYPGDFRVILVDDDSTDGTAAIARDAAGEEAARLTIVDAPPLQAGWAGKMNAVHAGVQAASADGKEPDFLLFTDADIAHGRLQVRRLVAQAERLNLVMASLMVMLWCRKPVERLLIPSFVFFFQMLFPFRWSNDPARRTAAAAGGCMLVRRTALAASGGIEGIKDALIDDCALAAQLKPHGPIWLGLTDRAASVRPYGSLGEIWRMVRRTAYTQLLYRPLLLLGTVLGMSLLFLAPPVLLLLSLIFGHYPAAAVAAATWLLMAYLYQPTWALYGLSPGWLFSLPLAGILYTGMTLDSARMHYRRRGGGWKGRTYDARNST